MKERLKHYWKNLIIILNKKELAFLPGQLAFFFVLSIIPILIILFLTAGWLNLSVDIITNFIKDSFSQNVAELILPLIVGKTIDLKFIIFVIIAFIIAANASHSVIITSNTIFNIPNSKFLPRRIKSLILTVIMIILMIFILLVPVFGQSFLNLAGLFGFENQMLQFFTAVLPILKWPISLFIIFFFIKVIYTIAPDAQIPSRYVNKGAIFTTIFWMLSSEAYSYYITHVARYDLFYGSLSGLIILMLWFYLMAYIFVVGLAINYRKVEVQIEKTNKVDLEEIKRKEIELHQKALKEQMKNDNKKEIEV